VEEKDKWGRAWFLTICNLSRLDDRKCFIVNG
jgi:hypothetical protein